MDRLQRCLQNDYNRAAIVGGGVNMAPLCIMRPGSVAPTPAAAAAATSLNESHRSHDAHPTVLCMI